MNISKILENTQPSSTVLPAWSSSSSAFEKYSRINFTPPQVNTVNTTDSMNPFLNFPPFSWSNLNGLPSSSAKPNEQVNDYSSSSPFSKLTRRPVSGRVSKKHNAERRPRTTFNVDQTGKLEEEYRRNEYVSRSRRVKLAQALDLTEGQVKIWFQNRRAKDKRIEKAQLDQRVRYIAFNMAALSCPSLIGPNSTILDKKPCDRDDIEPSVEKNQ